MDIEIHKVFRLLIRSHVTDPAATGPVEGQHANHNPHRVLKPFPVLEYQAASTTSLNLRLGASSCITSAQINSNRD